MVRELSDQVRFCRGGELKGRVWDQLIRRNLGKGNDLRSGKSDGLPTSAMQRVDVVFDNLSNLE